jgi:hypothetical protein
MGPHYSKVIIFPRVGGLGAAGLMEGRESQKPQDFGDCTDP